MKLFQSFQLFQPFKSFKSFALILSCNLFPLIYGKSITITWSTPYNDLTSSPTNGNESLKAILFHVQALLLADLIPKLPGIEKGLTIKLCPPQPYDPLITHFIVQRIAAYSAIYDHDCINKAPNKSSLAPSTSPAWGFKPKPSTPDQPQKPIQQPVDYYGEKGLTIATFILKLYKQYKTNQDPKITDPIDNDNSNNNNNRIWIIDSNSLKNYFTATILRSLHDKLQTSPAYQLLHQINVMRSNPEEKEKDLTTVPLAVQDSLLLVLPNYTEWTQNLPIKHLFFNPTWWSTRFVPRSKDQILNLVKASIEKTRQSPDQLIIIIHDPTPFNLELMTKLTEIYGDKKLLSSTRVLSKSTTTLQLLQFIQKAAIVLLDSRDLLGQVSLLSTGFPARIHQFQEFLPLTTIESMIFSLLGIWLFSIMIITIYHTDKYYDDKLHCHFRRIALFSILAITPTYVFIPYLWPKYTSMAIYSIFESGYDFIIYSILIFYSTALFFTLILLLVTHMQKNQSIASTVAPETAPLISDSESLQLIPK